jgi:putative tricarboxylic transport membrane protein
VDAVNGLLSGLEAALTPTNLLWLVVGCLLGTLVGILPGLGPPATIAILLPLATGFEPATGLIMMAGIYYGAKYGGSTTSILMNIPGESASVVTCIDGYQMAKQGRAGKALGIAAIASFVAGTIGVIGLTFLAPIAADVAVNFGPPEYSALMIFALLLVIMLAGDSMIKGFISMFVGLFLATIGTDLFSGEQRFTGGQIELAGGVEFIALSVGIFAIGEVLVNIEQKTQQPLFAVPTKLRELWPSKQDIKQSTPAMLQGGIVGFLIGILPGAGSTVASFVSYIIAKKTSKHPEEFGKGSIEGVAAPEAANNSETGGAMVPLLTMGIPGSGTGAVLLGALVLYGLNPGPLLFTEHSDVVWPIIASMYLGNIVLVIMNLPMVPLFAKLLNTPYKVLYPGILLIAVVGVFSVNFSVFDVWLLVIFGLLGYVMRKLDIPPAPLVLAFVLGPIAENSIRQSLLLSDNSPMIYLQRPISAGLIALSVLLLLALSFGRRTRKVREQMIDQDA